jgi:hypothetical protein
LKPFVAPASRSIDGPWEFLLMEAARKTDEDRHRHSGDDTVILNSAAAKKTSPPIESSFPELDEELVVVSTYDGQWHPVGGNSK